MNAQIVETGGFAGNFTTTIAGADGARQQISHGATILATGGQEYRGEEYRYGQHDAILTQQEFESQLHSGELAGEDVNSIVMIQCVGPAEKYCSRICCTVALKNAIFYKERHPGAQITVLYRDIRAYGFKEKLYTRARRMGVVFVRYSEGERPVVSLDGPDSGLLVRVRDTSLGRDFVFNPDRLVLSMPVVPRADARELAAMFKVSTGADGYFLEAHVKLRPVDFATDGIFMAGMVQYPKLLDEAVIQAQAAAARAARILSRDTITAGGRVAVVDPAKCTGCLTCVRICPFNVPVIQASHGGVGGILGAAYIEAAVCQGCGSCAAECPACAIQLMDYTDEQIDAMVSALFDEASMNTGKQ